ncbi:MAG TPA: ABC transporter substrate-binding protein, partial [Gemmatimonadales bacterium]
IRHGAPAPLPPDRAAARRLLAERGWRDTDRDGAPLSLSLIYPNTSGIRRQMALMIQEQWRTVGVRAELVQLEGPLWNERRTAGQFDVDFSAALQDPSPSGLTQSWSCAGGSNVAGFCDPAVDSLLEDAIHGRGEPLRVWHAALRRIEATAPATFLYAPVYVYAVHRRYQDVVIRPESSWLALWRWSVRGAATERPAGY